tara:strand:+ start:4743 stop:5498 length:756 start_codon:yes stop_codon:yes gene_type:complete
MSNQIPKINILNTEIVDLSMAETISLVKETIETQKSINLTDINAGKIIQIKDDPNMQKYVADSDVIQADGQAVIWASRFLNKPLKERVAGIDLVHHLAEMAYKNGFKIFLFGAKEEVVKKVKEKFSNEFNSTLIAGYRNGYFKPEDEPEIAEQISKSGAHILFVGITSPIQERFLYQNKEILKDVNFKMGVGGSFDVISGKTKRAPQWMQKSGLEWFYRFLQEPKRMWKRYLVGNTKFIMLVFKEKFFGKD